MSTRSLTAVKIDNEYKVAEFGYYDGYPKVQGKQVLDFLRNKMIKKVFLEKVRQLRFALTDEEYNELSQRQSELDGADILEYLQNNNETLVDNAIEFAKDTIFCIWAYLIDFDENTFEVYSARITSNLKIKPKKEFNKLNLLKKYNLDNLPNEDEFLNDFNVG